MYYQCIDDEYFEYEASVTSVIHTLSALQHSRLSVRRDHVEIIVIQCIYRHIPECNLNYYNIYLFLYQLRGVR
jgi:hypothetical protein